MTAVASTVDARSKVSAPEVVICPEGVTVTGKVKGILLMARPGTWPEVCTVPCQGASFREIPGARPKQTVTYPTHGMTPGSP